MTPEVKWGVGIEVLWTLECTRKDSRGSGRNSFQIYNFALCFYQFIRL